MNRLKRWIQKDHYGVVRGTLLLGVVMLLCTAMVIQLFLHYDLTSEGERASEAAFLVSSQFEQLIDSNLNTLTGAAELISRSTFETNDLLEVLTKYGAFSRIGILQDGALEFPDGTSVDFPEAVNHIPYSAGAVDSLIISDDNGGIFLCVPMDAERMLVGILEADQVEGVLCDAFIEDYGYAVYNAASGAYIINHTLLDDSGYFEALEDLNKNGQTEQLVLSGEGQALIKRSDGSDTDYYIAQNLTKIRPLGICLTIPKDLVRSEVWSSRIIPHATIFMATLMLSILISYTVFSLRRVYLANQKDAHALAAGEQMMNVISREARITLYMHSRKHGEISYCYDGLMLLDSNAGRKICTLNDIVNASFMDDSEAERLHDCIHDIKPGESFEMLARAFTDHHEERILRFTIFASSDKEQSVICCISDCTQEQASLDRIELERSYQASVQAKASSIWQINISRNRWKALHDNAHTVLKQSKGDRNGWSDYNADLSSVLREYLHPADYPAFAESMSIVGIASMFRSGKTEFTQDYRVVKNGCADYEWHRMSVRIWLNPETNDIFANLYVFNVNAEKNAELERGERKKILQQTMMALGGLYYGLYYVDLENDLSYTARSLGGDLVTQLCTPYKTTFDGYIKNSVHPEDQDALRNLLSAYQLRKTMTEGSHFRRKEYRRRSGDGYAQAAIIVQPARFENGIVKEVVLAIRYIGRDKEPEM